MNSPREFYYPDKLEFQEGQKNAIKHNMKAKRKAST